VDDIEQPHNVDIVHLFEKGDLTDCRRRDAFIIGFKADFLERDDAVVGQKVAGFIDDTVRT
jgi:hypothetical protein